MTELLIPIAVVVLAAGTIIYVIKSADEVKEKQEKTPKYQPRKVTFVVSETEKPKKKKKKYYNKKKKSTVVNNATAVAKRPVGRPRKTVE